MQRAEEKKHCRHSDGYPVARVASDSFKIRRATLRDADVIAWHRARMFQDMADVSGDAFEILRTKSRTRLEQWLDSGGYIGWLATPADEPEMISEVAVSWRVHGICAAAPDLIDDAVRHNIASP